MTSAVNPNHVIFGSSMTDDCEYENSFETSISSALSFESIGREESPRRSEKTNTPFGSPNFTFKTPKKIFEHSITSPSKSFSSVPKNTIQDPYQPSNRLPVADSSSSISQGELQQGRSDSKVSNHDGTKLLRKSTNKKENKNNSLLNFEYAGNVPFQHESGKSLGPGAWFWGVSIDTEPAETTNGPKDNLFAQFSTDNDHVQKTSTPTVPEKAFSLGSSSSIRNRRGPKHTGQYKSKPTNQSSKLNQDESNVQKESNGCEHTHIAEQCRKIGSDFYSKEDYENALEAFSKCISVCPKDWVELPNTFSNRAATLMMLMRYVEAIEDCDKALSLNSNMLRLMDRKGRAQLILGQLDAAESTFSSLLSSCYSVVSPTKYFEELTNDAKLGAAKVIEAKNLMKKVYAAAIAKENDVDVNDLSTLLEICPEMRVAQVLNIEYLCRVQQWEKAKSYAEEVLLGAHYTTRALYTNQDCATLVIPQEKLKWEICNKGIEVDRQSISNAMLCMGSDMARAYLCTLKNLDVCQAYSNDGMEIVRQVLTILGNSCLDSTWSWVQGQRSAVQEMMDLIFVAETRVKSGALDDAIRCFQQATQLNLDATRWNSILHYNIAMICHSIGRFDEALRECQESLQVNVSYQPALLCKARVQRAMGRVLNSTLDYRKYLRGNPHTSETEKIERELDSMLETYDEQSKGSESVVKDVDVELMHSLSQVH